MKFGVHTIAWGDNCQDLSLILKDVRDAGFAGIELFQHPDRLSLPGSGDCAARFDRLLQNDVPTGAEPIALVGVCFGAFEERKKFVQDLAAFRGEPLNSPSLPFIYTDEWGDEEKQALEEGLRVAIHPHMFQQIQTMREVQEILDNHPTSLFLPDTAHLFIAGDDPVAAIRTVLRSTEHKGPKYCRIPAVHFKDWLPNVGRSYQFYARGLCELGKGSVPLPGVVAALLSSRYDGWIMVEQDRTKDPRKAAEQAMNWLNSRFSTTKTA